MAVLSFVVFKWFTGDVEKNVLMVHSDGIHQLFDADVSIPVASAI